MPAAFIHALGQARHRRRHVSRRGCAHRRPRGATQVKQANALAAAELSALPADVAAAIADAAAAVAAGDLDAHVP